MMVSCLRSSDPSISRFAAGVERSPVFRPLSGNRSALSTATPDVSMGRDTYVIVPWTVWC